VIDGARATRERVSLGGDAARRSRDATPVTRPNDGRQTRSTAPEFIMTPTSTSEVDRLTDLLERYDAAVRRVARQHDRGRRDVDYEEAARLVVDLESAIVDLAPQVPIADRRRLLSRYDDGYVRDLLAVPRRR
jgi:hypothetical protein